MFCATSRCNAYLCFRWVALRLHSLCQCIKSLGYRVSIIRVTVGGGRLTRRLGLVVLPHCR